MNKIEGGPACKTCEGTGRMGSLSGRVYTASFSPCPTCEGTGIEPLPEWTDAEKAEWLNRNIPHPIKKGNADVYAEELLIRQPLLFNGEHYQWEVVLVSDPDECGAKRTEVDLAENKDFSAALTAAVIAVAKESHGPPNGDREV